MFEQVIIAVFLIITSLIALSVYLQFAIPWAMKKQRKIEPKQRKRELNSTPVEHPVLFDLQDFDEVVSPVMPTAAIDEDINTLVSLDETVESFDYALLYEDD
jgi:hypothetical protein